LKIEIIVLLFKFSTKRELNKPCYVAMYIDSSLIHRDNVVDAQNCLYR